MKLNEILYECECVYVDEDDNILSEAAVRQWKRMGSTIIKKYRCLGGVKAGKLVSDPSKCVTKKDPKKVRHGRKVMRSKKGTIGRKSKITKKRSLSKLVAKMNMRLMGK